VASFTMTHASLLSAIVQGGEKLRYRRRRTSICIAYALSKRAAAVANAAIRRSVPKPLSIVPSMAIDAACVQDEGYWTKLQINRPAVSSVLAPRGRSISKIPTN
jgi:hypothetical protein